MVQRLAGHQRSTLDESVTQMITESDAESNTEFEFASKD